MSVNCCVLFLFCLLQLSRAQPIAGAAVRRVSEGDVITLRCDDKAPDEPATVQNAALPAALAENDLLVIDDGQLVCRVLSADAKTGRVLTVANNSSSFGPGQRVVVSDFESVLTCAEFASYEERPRLFTEIVVGSRSFVFILLVPYCSL